MSDWLSSLWEPSWRSFRYFNLYRLILAGIAGLAMIFPQPWADPFHLVRSGTPAWLVWGYVLIVASGLALCTLWPRHFNRQLSAQVLSDVVVLSVFMYFAGGVASGLGVLLFVSLTAASLVGRVRLVLFYAALATLAVLGQQGLGILSAGFDPASIVHAGVLSAGFFGTALLARLLGQRVMFNEDLARRRGIALDNQQRINQRMLERMQDGVVVVDPVGQVLRYNPVAGQMLAIPEGGVSSLQSLHPALAEAFLAWRQGPGKEVVELAGGECPSMRARFEPTLSTGGEALIFIEDVARLQAQAQQLKLASLGRLTASIAHEIRNPLASISHAAELLREEQRRDLQERLLRILGDNVGRLDRIVQDVLELGRRDRAQPAVFDLAEFLAGFVDEFTGADNRPVGLIVLDCPSGLTIWFDRAHLHQILWNLLVNACRHASGQPGCIQVVAQQNASGQVKLDIIDDGSGIPADVREQIFEPFFTTEAKGTGLGLYIARELCAANSARLELGGRMSQGHFVIVAMSQP